MPIVKLALVHLVLLNLTSRALAKRDTVLAWLVLAGEVGPFVGVVFSVVKLLAAVAVSDVAPACAAKGVVSFVKRGDGKAIAGGFWVRELEAK